MNPLMVDGAAVEERAAIAYVQAELDRCELMLPDPDEHGYHYDDQYGYLYEGDASPDLTIEEWTRDEKRARRRLNQELEAARKKALLKRSGVPLIRPHDARHIAATLLLGQGVHQKLVTELLGHANVSITLDRYGHVTPAMRREAAHRLDALLGSDAG
ncbi:MAG: tyrosine-type recombinase/integrase [Candidatus Dormibacteria bacterium]